jgi:hypothetical protein
MNPKWKSGLLFLILFLTTLWPAGGMRNGAAQEAEPNYQKNSGLAPRSWFMPRESQFPPKELIISPGRSRNISIK